MQESLTDDALEVIRRNMARQVSRGAIESSDAEKAIERISFGESLKAFSQSDLVIEAATEDESTKRVIFKELCPLLKPDAIAISVIGRQVSSIRRFAKCSLCV